MASWNESDIGKIIVYRNSKGEDETVAIYNFDNENNNIIQAIEYPIQLKSKFAPRGLIKSQEVRNKEYLQKPGDWYLAGRVSKDELSVLEKLANSF